VEVQAATAVIVAALVAVNPAFEARPLERATSTTQALRDGLRALIRNPVLRATGASATLSAFGWGLMTIAFPLYAASFLHAGAHAGGYLWAAMATGSIVGTFVLAGRPTLGRVGMSYAVMGLSALLWPLANVLAVGLLLVGLTGFLEGPAYSGSIVLRQRHVPPAVRAQVLNSLVGVALVASSAGATISGAVHKPAVAMIMFAVVNAGAGLISWRTRGKR
jgi:MFS family permease